MNAAKINDCYSLLSEIHKYEDDLVMRYTQAGTVAEIEELHSALRSRGSYLGAFSGSMPRNFRMAKFFPTPE